MAMMSPNPPTFQEATRPCWWVLVAGSGHVDHRDYTALALVDRNWSQLIMPLIWVNPVHTARLGGLEVDQETAWWNRFISVTLKISRPQTRALVRVLDIRGFGRDAFNFTGFAASEPLREKFKTVVESLPSLSCVLLNGYADEALQAIVSQYVEFGSKDGLRLLSLAHYTLPLPESLWMSPALHHLVYLDISGVPGSIWAIIRPDILPKLRILKITNREVDDDALGQLIESFHHRLWSLDISSNKLTDGIIDHLVHDSFGAENLQSGGAFDIEGRLLVSNDDSAPVTDLLESEWSGTFSHPDRYLADAPVYFTNITRHPLVSRGDGLSKVVHDSEALIIEKLTQDDFQEWISHLDSGRTITHLDISNNQISSLGVERILRQSRGHLEYFACNLTPLIALPKSHVRVWPKTARLCGILGAAYALRPVISANLRTLSVHHSVVTQIPTLEVEGRSTLARWYLAETSILPRSERAYPQAFTPDMNPRLTSLTLSGIPRRSSGPLITKLVDFLKLLSVQEQSIRDVSSMMPLRRGPVILKGLRHLRLEFEHDPVEAGTWTRDDLNAEELMSAGEKAFSFFDDSIASSGVGKGTNIRSDGRSNSNGVVQMISAMEPDREPGDWIRYRSPWQQEGNDIHTLKVWIGTQKQHPNPIINGYRRLILEHDLREGVGLASPTQVLAGAPKAAYVFHTAWAAAIMPQNLGVPSSSDLEHMKDVFTELKRFRAQGREMDEATRQGKARMTEGSSPPFWHGNLTVCFHTRLPEESWR